MLVRFQNHIIIISLDLSISQVFFDVDCSITFEFAFITLIVFASAKLMISSLLSKGSDDLYRYSIKCLYQTKQKTKKKNNLKSKKRNI